MDTAQSRPRFRTDLVAQPIDDGGSRFVDVTDPDSGTTFRFYEVEYSIACAMDGQRDVLGLADWAEAELGIVPKPSPQELERVINTLADLGYLVKGSSPFASADIALGHAGVSEGGGAAPAMPKGADLELGFAGNENVDNGGAEMPQAPNIGLGHAGNEGLSEGLSDGVNELGSSDAIPILADDDDDEPTKMLERRAPSSPPTAVDLPPPPVPGGQVEPQPTLRPTTKSDSDEDGPTALPAPASDFEDEVSVDLSDHLKLGPDAIKEAVRASKMMPAVEPPPTPTPPPPPVIEPNPPELPVSAATATELPSKPAPPVSKPVEPKSLAKPPKKSNLGLLVILLLLAIIGALVAEYFLGVIGIREMLGLEEKPAPTPQPTVQEPVKKEPPPPKPPTAKLAAVEPPVQEIKAPSNGQIAFMVESGSDVQVDSVIAKLRGFERIESEVDKLEARLDYYQNRLARSEAAKKPDDIKRNQAKVDEKKAALEEQKAELEKFLIKAPVAGIVEAAVQAKARVKAEDTILSIKLPATLQATFDMPEGTTYAQDAKVALTSGDAKLGCAVIKVEGPKVTVDCPAGTGVEADADVTLPLPSK